jgi:hypothetical protein
MKYLPIALVSLLFLAPAVSHAQSETTNIPLTQAQYQSDMTLLISLIEQLLTLETKAATPATTTAITAPATVSIANTAPVVESTGSAAPVAPVEATTTYQVDTEYTDGVATTTIPNHGFITGPCTLPGYANDSGTWEVMPFGITSHISCEILPEFSTDGEGYTPQ